MSSFEKARQQAQMIHLEGMKKGFQQIVEQLQANIAKIESKIDSIKEQSFDE